MTDFLMKITSPTTRLIDDEPAGWTGKPQEVGFRRTVQFKLVRRRSHSGQTCGGVGVLGPAISLSNQTDRWARQEAAVSMRYAPCEEHEHSDLAPATRRQSGRSARE